VLFALAGKGKRRETQLFPVKATARFTSFPLRVPHAAGLSKRITDAGEVGGDEREHVQSLRNLLRCGARPGAVALNARSGGVKELLEQMVGRRIASHTAEGIAAARPVPW